MLQLAVPREQQGTAGVLLSALGCESTVQVDAGHSVQILEEFLDRFLPMFITLSRFCLKLHHQPQSITCSYAKSCFDANGCNKHLTYKVP